MRYRYIDILRGLASAAVLVWHYQHFYYPAAGIHMNPAARATQPFYDFLWPFYLHGGKAVELFWVLSGFVFAATYLTRNTTPMVYFANRFARLYPLHLATLLLVAALQAWSWHATGHYQIYRFNDGYHFALNLFFVQWWGLQSGYSFNAPTWSVSVEIAIYAVFFISIPAIKRSPLIGSIAAVGFTILLMIGGFNHGMITCAMFFYLGCVAWAALQRTPKASILVGAQAIVAFAISRWYQDDQLTLAEMATAFTGVVLIVGAIDILAPMRSRSLDWFGNATYGTYLLHVPIQIALLTIAQVAGYEMFPLRESGVFLVVFMGLTFGSAVVVYRWFELPANRHLRFALQSKNETQ